MVKNYNEILYENHTMHTQRLILRRMQPSDANFLLEFTSNTAALEYLFWEGTGTIEGTLLDIYNTYMLVPTFWGIEPANAGKLVGYIALRLDADHDKGRVGYMLSPAIWGKGYATEALAAVLKLGFDELKLNRLEADFFGGNEASRRVLEKNGMRFESMARQSRIAKGKYIDMFNYGITSKMYFDFIDTLSMSKEEKNAANLTALYCAQSTNHSAFFSSRMKWKEYGRK